VRRNDKMFERKYTSVIGPRRRSILLAGCLVWRGISDVVEKKGDDIERYLTNKTPENLKRGNI